MEYHSLNVRAVSLVEVPIVVDADLEFFHLYLITDKLDVLHIIWADLQSLNNFIQKVLEWTDIVTIDVVLIL